LLYTRQSGPDGRKDHQGRTGKNGWGDEILSTVSFSIDDRERSCLPWNISNEHKNKEYNDMEYNAEWIRNAWNEECKVLY
jgi:hypothetical protein